MLNSSVDYDLFHSTISTFYNNYYIQWFVFSITALGKILDLQNSTIPQTFTFSETESERDIILLINEKENGIALQENAIYMFKLTIISSTEDVATHFINQVLNVSIVDPDCKFICVNKIKRKQGQNTLRMLISLIKT